MECILDIGMFVVDVDVLILTCSPHTHTHTMHHTHTHTPPCTTHTHTHTHTQLPPPATTSGNPQPSSYTRQAPPSDTNMCGVYVTNVKTPSCLSVQLIGESTTKSLEYLLEDITQFYNSKAGDAYKILEPQIGQVKSIPFCKCAMPDHSWICVPFLSPV